MKRGRIRLAGVVERMQSLGETVALELDLELVQVQLAKEGGQWYLRFLIDSAKGIGIDDCERFSRRIDPLIESADPIPHHYILEVSSAGPERPLRREADYRRFIGRHIAVRLYEPFADRRRFTARLLGLAGSGEEARLDLERDDGKHVSVPLAKIAQAKLVPEI